MHDEDPLSTSRAVGWVILTLLLIVTFVFGVCTGRASASGGNGPCDQVRQEPAPLIRCVNERFPVPGGSSRAIEIASCESTLNPDAVNGRFLGLFQIGDSEWQSWPRPQLWDRWFGNPGRLHLRAHVITAMFHASRLGWGAWTCG